ncbi:hypothetical protein FLP10_02490 [Agromyces intestinalis]|uniref:4'-phosphopantetheinyl transferase superfamily protein n=1 Tax=Agromyces intestinalis TaxID=2592652 RepID=A0A5C1YBR0_9MICO|nr:hypothetical protein [Agromyces intestinalis]QEO13406.1 hypothetical protein FLP10_02490 [Agromyces intestinalis]
MGLLDDAELVILEDGLVTAAMFTGRRRPSAEAALAAVIAARSGIRADDIELDWACDECGSRHGAPAVEYPPGPGGVPWRGDAAAHGSLLVAASALGVRIGIGFAPGEVGGAVEDAAFHRSELDAIDSTPPGARESVRAVLWARKSALLRALGHSALLEPSALALSAPTADGAPGRIARPVAEVGAIWGEVRIHDLVVPGAGAVAALAVLP